jgi:hypothetical protein
MGADGDQHGLDSNRSGEQWSLSLAAHPRQDLNLQPSASEADALSN